MKEYLDEKEIIPIISLALIEDIGDGDITSNAIFNGDENSEAHVISKDKGIFCGGQLASLIYSRIDPSIRTEIIKKDGEKISPGDIAFIIKGHTKGILAGERTVLNFIQRMSGIATKTNEICQSLNNTVIKILDTRKTLPGFRRLDKYSVKMGGGTNHRIGLFDMVMIKDNHIKAAGGITAAVEKIKKAYGHKYRIEVETANLNEVKEAVNSGVDIIMLDNMDIPAMDAAINLISGKAKIEISGNVDEMRIRELKHLKVDYISAGALTHSVKAFDLSMRFL